MANQKVTLFGVSISPFSRRVDIALRLKCVEYEFIEEDLKNKSPSLLKYNPVHKKVPVLLHNGNPVCESGVILEYIDEMWNSATPILPEDPYERAIARFWAKFIDDKCQPAVWKACFGQGEEQQKGIVEAKEHLQTLENEIKGKKFFGGEKIGLVDIVANLIALWVGVFQEVKGVELLTKDKFPNLVEWSDNYLKNSIIKESLPPRDELLNRFRALFG